MTNKSPLALILLLIAHSVLAAPGNDSGVTVTFDHAAVQAKAQSVSARKGQTITIVIRNTCPENFVYELGGIPLETAESAGLASSGCTPQEHRLVQVHDENFAGYFINIVPKNAETVTTDSGVTLSAATYLVSVKTTRWDVGFAGGFTISDVTSPVYASRQNDSMENVVFRDTGAEDDVTLGAAAMVHLYHHNLPWLAATFGISTGSGSELSYLVGPSYRFGDKAALTLGYMWAPVDRLPSGLAVGDRIEDPNTLSNLQTKLEGGVFLSFSYSFISGVRGVFEKPFKGSDQSAQSGAAALTGPTGSNGVREPFSLGAEDGSSEGGDENRTENGDGGGDQ